MSQRKMNQLMAALGVEIRMLTPNLRVDSGSDISEMIEHYLFKAYAHGYDVGYVIGQNGDKK